MARIYVSSTYSDLKEHREVVHQTLRRLAHEVMAMEDYNASDERPLEKCLKDVASCDAYVGIFALRYGYIPQGYDKSITELEYRHAVELRKPCLIFLLADDAPWLHNQIEFGAYPQIQALRTELSERHLGCVDIST